MSKYTTEVRFICEHLAGLDESGGASDVNEILDECWDKIFENFPIFDEEYRSILCKKILKHFYTREIGFETYGLWKLKLNTKMEEIMPYYNRLYLSTQLDYDPLHQIDYTRTVSDMRNKSNNESVNGTKNRTDALSEINTDTLNSAYVGDSSNTIRDLYSDTPQGALNGVENETYLTSANKKIDSGHDTSSKIDTNNRNKSLSDTVNESTSNSKAGQEAISGQLTERITGKRGGESYSKLIEEYRHALLNVDLMVFGELNELFMQLW